MYADPEVVSHLLMTSSKAQMCGSCFMAAGRGATTVDWGKGIVQPKDPRSLPLSFLQLLACRLPGLVSFKTKV